MNDLDEIAECHGWDVRAVRGYSSQREYRRGPLMLYVALDRAGLVVHAVLYRDGKPRQSASFITDRLKAERTEQVRGWLAGPS